MTANKTVKVGVIGCGGIGYNKHLPAIKKIPEARLSAFCDSFEDRAYKAAKEYGAPGSKTYADYRDLLSDPTIDVVHVCTPNKSHSFISVDALNAGKHVMCEKPMAISFSEAKKMLDASKSSGKLLSIAYQNRFRADSMYLKKCCERGDLGEVYFAKAHAIRRRKVPTWGVFLNAEEQGGGPLIDIGTHALDLTLWLMDNYQPKSVVGSVYKKLNDNGRCGNAFGEWRPQDFTVEDSAFGFITMKNGATIFLESSWALNVLEEGEAITTLCGTKAGADMRDGLRINFDEFDKLTVKKPDLNIGEVAYFTGVSQNPDDIEQRVFYDAVLYDKPLTVLPEQALVVTQLLEAIYTSSKTGKQISFE